MKRLAFRTLLSAGLIAAAVFVAAVALPPRHTFAQAPDPSASCHKNSFLGLKPWYFYLPLSVDSSTGESTKCHVDLTLSTGDQPNFDHIKELWLIAIVLFEDLLRVAALAAVGFVMYGGVRYITSQGEPENTKAALNTIINALIGLAIAVAGSTLVAFVARRLGA